ncbi:hypothetical protein E5357_04345 [Hominisplanchenecus murintestinalis]|uniref:Uncharacterized protein n=1 Tax=Hominisplanchenecus murintestinalis TaxID=2941517 RepID=A0AC61R1H1_9FIRM|nr:hypothetical protein [Hominisplanchenecus murintestinalis]TGX99715.1 hypothetical protein E5357_04345 [Hominisplanchenecus murintestinalis]
MDKYEYSLKLEEINRLVENDNYEDAAKIADTVDWKRVRNARTLCMVSEIYEANDRLEDSRDVLMRAYRRAQGGRMIVYRLAEVAIQMREFDEAIEYYSEFADIAPNDYSRYVLKYKIYKGRGSRLEEQIAILEEYKEKEYTEKWAYELALLYYKAGEEQKCVEECDDLVLWFRQGDYVIKALELKSRLTPLTAEQRAIYEHRDELTPNKAELVEAAVPTLEKVITEKMPTSEEEAITDNIISETEKELAQAVSQHAAEAQAEKEDQDNSWRYHTGPERTEEEHKEAEIEQEKSAEEVSAEGENSPKEIPGENSDKQEPSVEDLQREIANSMRELVSDITRKESDEGIIEPMNDKPVHSGTAQTEERTEPPKENIDDVLMAMAVGTEEQAMAEEESEPAQEESEAETKESEEEKVPEVPGTDTEAQKGAEQPKAETEEEGISAEIRETGEVSQVPETDTQKPAGDTIDLSAALERAAGVENMRPNTAEPNAAKEEAKKEPVSNAIPQLTLEEQYIFSYFSSIQGLREQIAAALQDAKQKVKLDRTSRSGNVVITGLPGSGRTTLAIRIAKALSKYKGENSARVAKIYAEDFNKKDIPSTVAKIAGGTLIIEEAGDLSDSVAKQLAKAMEFRTDGLVIILEDEKHLLKALFDRHPELAEKFTSEVTVPIFTNDELVAFGKTYAFDEDYKIDDMATMVLYNRIGEKQTSEHPVTVLDVKDIVDDAIRNSEKLGLRKLGMILSKKRYDSEDRIILYEKDFK